MSSKNPEIRFNGFTEAWEQRKLKNLTLRKKSYSLSRNIETLNLTGYKYIHYGDIHRKVADIVTHNSELPNIEPGNYELLEKGDLVLADASEDYQGIAMPSLVAFEPEYKLVAGLHTIVLKPEKKKLNPLFLYYLIHSPLFRRYGYRIGTGMKVFGISVSNLLNFESLVPTLKEQDQISIFLLSLDNTIALHQHELTLLKQRKKAFLQKIYPEKEFNLPKLRFSRFEKCWERKKIREICDISAGGDIDKSKLVNNGIYPVIANALTNNGVIGYYNSYKVEAPAVTVTGRGDVGHANARYENFTPVVRLLVLKANNFDINFLQNCINSLNIFVESTGVPQLTSPQLGGYEILFPLLEEQQKIGNFFKQLDESIALHEQKLESLKQIKKAFLQKMFV